MINAKVTYTVKRDFADTNKQNIKAFLSQATSTKNPGFQYTIFVGKDGKTFTHIGKFINGEVQKAFLELPAFKYFQAERDKRLETEPRIEFVEEVGSTHQIFE